MLSTIKDKAKGIVFKGFMFLLALSFVAWGVGDFIQSHQFSAAVKVGGTEISVQEVDHAWRSQLKQLEQQVGPEAAKQIAQEMHLDTRLVDGLVQNTLIQNAAKNMHLVTTDPMIAGTIKAMPYFAGIDGQFDQARFEAALRSADLSPKTFESMVADQLREDTLRSAFSTLNLVDPKAFERFVILSTQTRNVKLLAVTASDLPPPAEPTTQQIQDAYQDHKEDFKTEEKRDVALLVLDITPLMDKQPLDTKKLDEALQDAKASATMNAPRHSRHILVATEAEAQNIITQLKKGADFSTLAKTKSIDTGSGAQGGDLGFAPRGVMVPRFEEALFALKTGEISAPVQSDFGWHVIQLLAIQPVDEAELDKKRAAIIADLKRDAAEPAYIALKENIADRIAGGDSLDAIAEEFNLFLTRYPGLPRSGNGTDVLGGQQVLAEAFRLDEGEISQPLTLAPEQLAYVVASHFVPEDYQPLDLVRGALTKSLKRDALLAAQRSFADTLLADFAAGQSLEDIAKARNLHSKVQIVLDVTRKSHGMNPLIGDLLVERIFQTGNNKLVPGVHPIPGGVALVQVVSIHNRQVDTAERKQLQQAYHNLYKDDTYKLFTQYLKDNAAIDINQKAVNNITGIDRE